MFNPVQVIQRKRDGHKLSADDIAAFMAGYVRGDVLDYQMSALAMAILLRDMDAEETATLTRVMLESGERLGWDGIGGIKVDKHSTGGMGDKVSLPLAPLLACCGLKVPMISGRGLGLTGGTLDKLDAIPGFKTRITTAEIRRLVDTVGVAMAGQTENLVPADRKLYALRDVTATVPSVPLITASILSKKAAESLDALVLDIKWGRGAFMQTLPNAQRLARSLVDVGTALGMATTGFLTDMNQPLGRAVGHATEVNESLAFLEGNAPADLREVTLTLAAELLVQTKVAANVAEALKTLDGHIASGAALAKFHEMVRAQGGRLDGLLPVAPAVEVVAPRAAYIAGIDLEKIGYGLVGLGAGRTKVNDAIDFSVGLEMLVRIGERVEHKQPLLRAFVQQRGKERALALFAEAFEFADAPPAAPQLIVERISSNCGAGFPPANLSASPTVGSTASQSAKPGIQNADLSIEQRLVQAAIAVRANAYARYSDFPVGAALATATGEIVVGVNCENASYGLTQCAERTAVTAAVAAGHRKFTAVAIASKGGVTPCGACRQVLAEFCDDMDVFYVDVNAPTAIHRSKLSRLLPGKFVFDR